jgi:hypothetical protein
MSEFEEAIVTGRCSRFSLLASEFGTRIAL